MLRHYLGVGLLVLAISGVVASGASAADWARFRGPNGSGVCEETASTPVTWSATENLRWKVALPGPGSSCPIVVGDKVIVTCWSGYAMSRNDLGEQKDLKRHLVCLDRQTGKMAWSQSVDAYLPEDRYGGMFAENGYASHTPVSDGKRIFAFFGKSGVAAFDMDGKQLWLTQVGTESDPRGWGTASSPILYENLVIVTAAVESQSLIALDQETGKEVWRKKAEGFESTWGTPVLVKVNDTRTDLVIGVPYDIWGFDPTNGKFRWYCPAMQTDSFCSSLAVDGDTVIAIEGRGGGSIAVRAGGEDDVSKTHVVWNGRDSNRIGTPVVHDGRVYFFSNRIANCIDAKTGKKIYQSRLSGGSTSVARAEPEGGPQRGPGGRPGMGGGFGGGGFGGRGGGMGGQDYSSPVIADGKLYFVARNGDAYVIKLGPTFEQLAVNRVTDEAEDFSASPAVSGGALFIRSSKHVYCVAKGQ